MKVYVLLMSPRSEYEEGEGDDTKLLGVFSKKETINGIIEEDIQTWHPSCGITHDNYWVEETYIDEVL